MKTTAGSVSNICYADAEYLRSRLSLRNELTFWAVIDHPEYTTETGDTRKRHCHVYIEAGDRIDLTKLSVDLSQVMPGADPPLGCMRWTRSRFEDWLPYAVHDADYLAFKGLKKPYYDLPLDRVHTSDPEYLRMTWQTLPRSSWLSPVRRIALAVATDVDFLTFADRERLSYTQIPAAFRVYRQMQQDAIEAVTRTALKEGFDTQRIDDTRPDSLPWMQERSDHNDR